MTVSSRPLSSTDQPKHQATIISDGKIPVGTRVPGTVRYTELVVKEVLETGPAKGDWSGEGYKGMAGTRNVCICEFIQLEDPFKKKEEDSPNKVTLSKKRKR